MDREELGGVVWRKSSYSGANGGNCVEVGKADTVLVRDTKDRTGPVLRFSPATWRRFADQMKRSLAPDAAGVGEQIFTMTIHGLIHLFTGGSEPRQIPPRILA